ncbi:LysR substrate-binding domain-containing protein [Xenophilus azovorans]|uniref:LysR substrate-binding domain-containing protein n=1 Tax=Xenophilus azovorans TaxID=151755 RepID=UPI00068BBCD7|nr:LysR substrate-binding domain-containing protein [Xenophilus azovorans]
MGTVDDLMLLIAVIEAGSFSGASRNSGIPKSRLSRRISELETRLGVQLLSRGSRRFSATEAGLAIYERGLKIKAEVDAISAIAEDRMQRPTGALRIACPALISERLVAAFAVSFSTAHPDVKLCLETSNGTFDPKIDHYDLSIHPAQSDGLADCDLVHQKLVTADFCLVASPEVAAMIGKAAGPKDLEGEPGIGWSADGFTSRWQVQDARGETATFNVSARFSASSLAVIHQAALTGLGLARLPRSICEADLARGTLVLPLPAWSPPSITIYALYPSRRSLTLAGRLFVSGLARHLQESMHGSTAGLPPIEGPGQRHEGIDQGAPLRPM